LSAWNSVGLPYRPRENAAYTTVEERRFSAA